MDKETEQDLLRLQTEMGLVLSRKRKRENDASEEKIKVLEKKLEDITAEKERVLLYWADEITLKFRREATIKKLQLENQQLRAKISMYEESHGAFEGTVLRLRVDRSRLEKEMQRYKGLLKKRLLNASKGLKLMVKELGKLEEDCS